MTTYVITAIPARGCIEIVMLLAANIIKLDFDVEIIGFEEVSVAGGRIVRSATFELSTGAEIEITSPKGTFSYQIGDGAILTYDDFKTAIGASGTNASSTLNANFTVPFPQADTTPPPAGVDNPATAITLGAGAVTTIAENTDITGGVKIADLVITDADGGSYGVLTISGADAALFELRDSTSGGKELWLKETATLDFEAKTSFTARVELDSDSSIGTDVSLAVTNVNEAPTATPDTNITITEGMTHTFSASDFGFADVDAGAALASITITSLPTLGSLTLNGAAVTASQTILASDIPNLEFTSTQVLADQTTSLTYTVSDGVLSSAPATLNIAISGDDDVATAIAIGANPVTTLEENTDTTGGLRIAEFVITDPDGGNTGVFEIVSSVANTTDKDFFELRNDATTGALELWLKDGVSLDFETKSDFNIRIQLQGDDSVGVDATLNITDVGEDIVAQQPQIHEVDEHVVFNLFASDFGYDPDAGETFTAVKIKSLPTGGSLSFDGLPVTVDQVLNVVNKNGLPVFEIPGSSSPFPLPARVAEFFFTPNLVNGDTDVTFEYTLIQGSFETETATYTIKVTDTTPPSIPRLEENADGSATAIELGEVASPDATGTPTFTLVRAVSGLNGTAVDGFNVDSSTGAVTYTGTGLDYETVQSVTLYVTDGISRTDDNGQPLPVVEIQFIVQITNVDEPTVIISLNNADPSADASTYTIDETDFSSSFKTLLEFLLDPDTTYTSDDWKLRMIV